MARCCRHFQGSRFWRSHVAGANGKWIYGADAAKQKYIALIKAGDPKLYVDIMLVAPFAKWLEEKPQSDLKQRVGSIAGVGSCLESLRQQHQFRLS